MTLTNGGWDRRFLSTTRGQVVTLLSRAARTVEELAAALGVTDNAVRSHLSVLERDGLVRQHGVRRSGGKPAYIYDVTPVAEQLFPKAYGPVLGLVLDVLGERLPADAVEGVLREVAARLVAQSAAAAHRGGTAGDRIQRAVAVLEELGGSVDVEGEPAKKGKVRLRAHGCPLASAVPRHPEACQMLASVLTEVIGAPVTECCEREGRPRCCFEVAFGRRRAA
jgi:predicted ArsR family transcriptional regulator